jgi:hypothetical protein
MTKWDLPYLHLSIYARVFKPMQVDKLSTSHQQNGALKPHDYLN